MEKYERFAIILEGNKSMRIGIFENDHKEKKDKFLINSHIKSIEGQFYKNLGSIAFKESKFTLGGRIHNFLNRFPGGIQTSDVYKFPKEDSENEIFMEHAEYPIERKNFIENFAFGNYFTKIK